MHHLQATVTMLLWMWFLNVWDNVPMDLKYACQQYFTCMCFLGFIQYNKTFIACRFRKYENLFTPQGIWYSWVNKFSYFPHQHAINVYYYIVRNISLLCIPNVISHILLSPVVWKVKMAEDDYQERSVILTYYRWFLTWHFLHVITLFSSPGQRPCGLLSSLGIRRLPSVRPSIVCRKL
jgi:hypothetical protein